MKKTFYVLVALLLVLHSDLFGQSGNWRDFANTDWFGNGTKTMYTLSTAEELAGLAQLVNAGHIFKDTTIVLSDKVTIDLKDHFWTPIGYKEKTSFNGVFDGNGQIIRNLYIGEDTEEPSADNIQYKSTGLFGYIGGGAILRNLTLEGGTVVGLKNLTTANYAIYTGGLVGKAISADTDSIIVKNCHNKGTSIIGGFDYSSNHDGSSIGGLIGYANGKVTIDSCSNEASVTLNGSENMAFASLGGIAGSISGHFTIITCRNIGSLLSIYGKNIVLGGLIGDARTDNINKCRISRCYNSASITDKEVYASGYCGGLLGTLNHKANNQTKGGLFILENSFSNTSFDAPMSSGFFVGSIAKSSLDSVVVQDCYATGKQTERSIVSLFFNLLEESTPRETGFRVSGCLFVSNDLEHNYFLRYATLIRMLSQTNISYKNNYLFANGCPALENRKDISDWSGMMAKAPISGWDKSAWEIDSDNKLLPRLKGFTNSTELSNPLYNQPEGYYSVLVPNFTGAKISYEPGTYKVKKEKDFAFTVEAEGGGIVSDITVKTLSGTAISTYKTDNEIYYWLTNITKDEELVIEGKGINYQPDDNWPAFADTAWYYNTPKKKSYTLSKAEEFAGLANIVNAGHQFKDTTFVLGDSIDLRSHNWVPIALSDSNRFRGTLDGNHKTIRNMQVTGGYQSAGLFGYLGGGSQVKNLTIRNGIVKGITDYSASENGPSVYTGGLSGAISATSDSVVIRNCHISNVSINAGYKIWQSGRYTFQDIGGSNGGGLIGNVDGRIILDSCSNAGADITKQINYSFMGGESITPITFIRGINGVGGLVGAVNGSFVISNSSTLCNTLANNSDADFVGGILGYAALSDGRSSSITSCFNNDSLQTYSSFTGGVAGYVTDSSYVAANNSSFVLANCYSYAPQQASGGGLIGALNISSRQAVVRDNYAMLLFDKPKQLLSDLKTAHGGLIYKISSEAGSIEVTGNLLVATGDYPSANRLIIDSIGKMKLSDNYAFVNGNPLDDKGNGLNGISWSGKIDGVPFSSWSKQIWDIKSDSKFMPAIKNMPNQQPVPNPLYGLSAYFDVTLTQAKGIITSYKAGTYKVLNSTDFIVEVTGGQNTNTDDLVVETTEGKPLELIDKTMGIYALRNVTKPTTIVISGMKDRPVGNEEIEIQKNNVRGGEQCVYVNIVKPSRIDIYSIMGQLIKQQELPAGSTTISLPKGVYIGTIDGRSYKLFVW